MKRSTCTNEEANWHAFTSSELPYSISWNDTTGRVRVVTSSGEKLYSKKSVSPKLVMSVGESFLGANSIKRNEFNAVIPVIKLE